VAESNKRLFEQFFFSFLFFLFLMLLIYFEQEKNEITNFFYFFICCKIKEMKKLNTKEFLRKQQETKISEGYNLINGAKL